MIESFSFHTAEIDDCEAAAAELGSWLDLRKLRKNSLGLVSCYAEFINSGVVAALAKVLPFPLAGITTIAGALPAVRGEMLLILTVLTSDEVEFAAAVTEPLSGEDEAPLRAAWERITAGRDGRPSLMLSFAPLLLDVSGDFFADAWTSITGNVPNFGTLAVDHNRDYHESQTILGGEAYRDRYVFVLLYGRVEPAFFVGGISEEKAFREKGVVTDSQGNLLKAVNGVSVADYLTGLGLSRDESGNIEGINSYPFILDYNDGTQPIIRVMFAVTPDGQAVCGGKMPLGATLTVGTINADGVLYNSAAVLEKALKAPGKTILIFSCVGRFFAMGFNPQAEMEKVQELLGGRPFHLCYSGTELCPVYGKDGGLTNRSHNDTMVICVL
ncbi:MAG: FIST C-terminal domain-containing protein [Treponema sp.]|nr:FIST C-terminal domain-containing protein [Treponema sp.]